MRSFNRKIEIIFLKTKAYIKTLSNTRLGSTYKPDFAHLFILGNRRFEDMIVFVFLFGFFWVFLFKMNVHRSVFGFKVVILQTIEKNA